MNRLHKIAALCVAAVMASTLLVGCRNEEDIAQKLEYVKAGCEKSLANESGDILIFESVKVQKKIEGIAENNSEDTYIKYVMNDGEPDFSLTRLLYGDPSELSEEDPSEGTTTYVFEKVGDTMIELLDGIGNYAESAPDIFEQIHADFEVADVKSVELEDIGKGISGYKFVMSQDYADTFDRESDGAAFDCKKIVYTYYIDGLSVLSNITREYTYTLTYEGESQTVVEFIDVKTE